MLKSRSNDVLFLDYDALTFVRFASQKKELQLLQAKSARISGAFTPAAVTPELTNAAALTEAIKRLRSDAGSLDRVALLLPDSWFRMNLLELNELPDRREEAEETIRWAIKRSLPIPAEQLRLAYHVIGRTDTKRRVLAISALAKALAEIERTLDANGIWATTIEPVGLNVWNAIVSSTPPSTRDRLLIHVRSNEFTTALFRGEEPIFLRSRNLRGERSVAQEIRLSASYLRENMGRNDVEQCFVTGNDPDGEISRVLAEEFGAPVRRITSKEFVRSAPGLEASALDSEVIASRGVFAA